MKKIVFVLFVMNALLSSIASFSQQISTTCTWSNVVVVEPTDTEKDIVWKAAHVIPTARQLRWQKLELTAFFHFGVNTFTGKEWGTGKENPKIFNPISLNAEQWVKTAKDAGIKQVILTAKHHDGFCLWPTKTTEHSVKNSLWKEGHGDVVKEVTDACRKYKIGFGIYLSPWDMNSPVYGTEAYNDFFVHQLTELLTKYGRIDEVWFDGANGEGTNGKKQVYDFDNWYKVIRRLQPAAVIAIMAPDVRWVGTETGQGRETEWSVVPANNLERKSIAGNSQQGLAFKPQGDMRGEDIGSREKIRKAKALVWYPAETDVSIRPGWFFHEKENNKVKTPQQLTDIYFNSVGRNGVLLLNIPPNKKGLIEKEDSLHLVKWRKIIRSTFKNNLASSASIKLSSGKNVKALVDELYNTYWTTASSKDTTAEIVFTLPHQQTFDVLLLQENIKMGQRIEKFSAEYWNGEQWIQFIEGTTVGYKRLLRFNAVKTNKVRLKILSSRLNPTLSEVGFYKQADIDITLSKSQTDDWKLVFKDEFNSKGQFDTSKWSFCPRGNPAWTKYLTPSFDYAYLDSSNLILKMDNSVIAWDSIPYHSAGISTQTKFSFTYGKVEVRAKFEKGKGSWPAIWMMPEKPVYGGWPNSGEIDIMEHVNREGDIHQTIHNAAVTQRDGGSSATQTTAYNINEYNVYGIIWNPDSIDFYINGSLRYTYTKQANATSKDWPFDKPFYLILNQSGGAGWPGAITDADLPFRMTVDWVRIYQKK